MTFSLPHLWDEMQKTAIPSKDICCRWSKTHGAALGFLLSCRAEVLRHANRDACLKQKHPHKCYKLAEFGRPHQPNLGQLNMCQHIVQGPLQNTAPSKSVWGTLSARLLLLHFTLPLSVQAYLCWPALSRHMDPSTSNKTLLKQPTFTCFVCNPNCKCAARCPSCPQSIQLSHPDRCPASTAMPGESCCAALRCD